MPHIHTGFSAALAVLLCVPQAHAQGTANPAVARSVENSAPWAMPSPAQTKLPQSLVRLVRAQDVLSYAAPGVLYPVRNVGLQCQGVNATLADVSQGTALASTATGRTEPRFGEAALAGIPVFRLQASAHDVLPAGSSPRCELVSYPMPESALPHRQSFWMAFSFWADDWSGTHDDQSIAQFHIEEPRHILLNPFFVLVVRGSELRVEIRHNAREVPDQASTQLVTVARQALPVRQWVTAVVHARLSPDPTQAPFLRLWLNGTLAADYTGPLGYALPPGGYAYAKVGIYHWLNGNAWDLAIPTRALLVGAMLTVQDSTGRYSADQIQSAVTPADRR